MKESKVYGLNAALAYAKHRADKVIRAYYRKEYSKQFQPLQKVLAKNKKVYRVVSDVELEKIAQSTHHEGVCLIVASELPISIEDWLKTEKQKSKSVLLVLENISNPHNLGAIVRIASHFGINAIASQDAKALSSGAAMRIAEGGAEFVRSLAYKNLPLLLSTLKTSGYTVVSTSSHSGTSLYKYGFPNKLVILFGAEGDGLSAEALQLEDQRLQIPGTGTVESLNVSTAIAVVIAEVWRQYNK